MSNLHKFTLFHLMENIPFDMPHTVYINILWNLKNLGGMDNIFYAVLINKILWDHGVYHVFKKMDKDSMYNIIVKRLYHG